MLGVGRHESTMGASDMYAPNTQLTFFKEDVTQSSDCGQTVNESSHKFVTLGFSVQVVPRKSLGSNPQDGVTTARVGPTWSFPVL